MVDDNTLPGLSRGPFPKVPDSVLFIKHRSPPAFSRETEKAPHRDELADQVPAAAGRNILAASLFCAVLIVPSHLEMLETREGRFPSFTAHSTAERPRLNEFRAPVTTTPPQALEAEPDSPPALSERPEELAVQAGDRRAEPATRTAPAPSYYVQVGTFQVQRNAEQFLERIRRFSETAGMTRIEYRGAPLFIVYLDRFEHPAQAHELARTISRDRETVVVQLTEGRYRVVRE